MQAVVFKRNREVYDKVREVLGITGEYTDITLLASLDELVRVRVELVLTPDQIRELTTLLLDTGTVAGDV